MRRQSRKSTALFYLIIALTGISLIFPELPAEAANFTTTGSMIYYRDEHTATMLDNNTVLIAGGDNGGGSLNRAEIYDPGSWTFSVTGDMIAARTNHTATKLANGKVLITGGGNSSGNLASCELYDPATRSFAAAGNLIKGRRWHTATLLKNGKVLIAGGYNSGALNKAELYDPDTDTFTATGNLVTGRFYHTATLLADGKVLMTGGVGSDYLDSAEIYDPANGTFTATGSMTTTRRYHVATSLTDGKVLITGGDQRGTAVIVSAEIFDPASGIFSPAGDMTAARKRHTGTLLKDGKILVVGGWNNSGYQKSADLFDPVNGTFSKAADMGTSREFHTATLLSDGMVLIAGGSSISGYLQSAELYSDQLPSAPKTLRVSSINPDGGVAITVNPPDNRGISSGHTEFELYYASGTQVTLTAPAKSPIGSVFSQWTGCDSVNGAQCTVTLTSDRTVTSVWNSTTYPVQITLSGAGSGTINSNQNFTCEPPFCEKWFENNTQITLIPSPAANSLFQWTSGQCSGSGDCTLAITGPVTLAGRFLLNQPVKLLPPQESYYDNFQQAYDNISGSGSILARKGRISGSFLLNRAIAITLMGGFNADFSNREEMTTMSGILTLESGVLTPEWLAIE